MKSITIISVLALLSLAYVMYPDSQGDYDSEFEEFISMYAKSYMNQNELAFRKQVFQSNMKRAQELNDLNPEAEFGVTMFADLTIEEMERRMGAIPPQQIDESVKVHTQESHELEDIDHTRMMRSVQDQGDCGSCWAFAATAAFEGRHALHIDKWWAYKFSEQQALDCSASYYGCQGGWYEATWKHLMNHKFCKDWDYPYIARESECQASTCGGIANDTGYNYIARSEAAMHDALKSGPIAIAVDATTWGLYKRGIIDNCSDGMNHAVVIVGYEEDNNAWVVRNSWSSWWGEWGHLRLRYGQNTCNLLYNPAYPTFD